MPSACAHFRIVAKRTRKRKVFGSVFAAAGLRDRGDHVKIGDLTAHGEVADSQRKPARRSMALASAMPTTLMFRSRQRPVPEPPQGDLAVEFFERPILGVVDHSVSRRAGRPSEIPSARPTPTFPGYKESGIDTPRCGAKRLFNNLQRFRCFWVAGG